MHPLGVPSTAGHGWLPCRQQQLSTAAAQTPHAAVVDRESYSGQEPSASRWGGSSSTSSYQGGGAVDTGILLAANPQQRDAGDAAPRGELLWHIPQATLHYLPMPRLAANDAMCVMAQMLCCWVALRTVQWLWEDPCCKCHTAIGGPMLDVFSTQHTAVLVRRADEQVHGVVSVGKLQLLGVCRGVPRC